MILSRNISIFSLLIVVSFILTLVVLFPSTAQAKMYKWVDDQGKTHFTDSKSKIPPKYRDKPKPEKEKKKKPRTSGSRLRLKGIQNEYVVVSKKGNSLILKDFIVGYERKGEITKSDSAPFGVETVFGFFFKLPLMEIEDSLKIVLEVQVPLVNREGEKKKFYINFTFKNPEKPGIPAQVHVFIEDEEVVLKTFKVPGEWTLTLYNQKRPFASQTFRVYLP